MRYTGLMKLGERVKIDASLNLRRIVPINIEKDRRDANRKRECGCIFEEIDKRNLCTNQSLMLQGFVFQVLLYPSWNKPYL